MFERKFFRCNHCGNLFEAVIDAGVPVFCCGEVMQALQANAGDGATEKHVPVIERNGDTVTVKVGSAAHPMLEEHSIQWILLAQDGRTERVALKPGEAPEATFALRSKDAPLTAYEYCNLHGLWVAESE
ncbi:MAG: desulfoferrodoxin [Clostridiales Family XIII bacterium]|jgi:superoxide reductase|nr:desulfoferrodoxin [Clostridiales Family XIII bacterium]